MTARDQEVHDALVRTIACRLPRLSTAELRVLDDRLADIEHDRHALSLISVDREMTARCSCGWTFATWGPTATELFVQAMTAHAGHRSLAGAVVEGTVGV